MWGTEPKDRRAERALQVFQEKEIVHYFDLPNSVGWRTVDRLIANGFIEPVDQSIGRYTKRYAWRLVPPTTEPPE
jgi:hypothetical protein